MLDIIYISAFVYASLLVLLCIGFTLTHIISKIPNFAHGTYAGIGIYVTYTFAMVLNLSPYAAFPVAFFLGGIINMLIYKLIIGFISKLKRGVIILTISTIAIQLLLTSLINIYAFWLREVFKTYAQEFFLKEMDFKMFNFAGIFFVSLGISITTVITLHYILTKTQTGIAMRATAEKPQLAQVLGIDIDKIQLFSWFLTGGLACLAGAMLPLYFMSTPETGNQLMPSVMAGSLLGGLDSVYGAIIGGLIIGSSEILLTTWGSQNIGIWVGEYRSIIPLCVLIIVLLLEPKGLNNVWVKFKKTPTGIKLLKSIGMVKWR